MTRLLESPRSMHFRPGNIPGQITERGRLIVCDHGDDGVGIPDADTPTDEAPAEEGDQQIPNSENDREESDRGECERLEVCFERTQSRLFEFRIDLPTDKAARGERHQHDDARHRPAQIGLGDKNQTCECHGKR